MTPTQPGNDDSYTDSQYQTFEIHDLEQVTARLLAQVDYLQEMFDLTVDNERGKPIVITLREKSDHFNKRQREFESRILAKAGMARFAVND